MNDNQNDDDKLKEEIEKLIKEQTSPKNISFQMGFLLHKRFGMHILLTLMTNLLVAAIIIGLSRITISFVEVYSFEAFFIAITLYTFIEIPIKLLSLKYMFKYIVRSFGFIFFIYNVAIFFVVSLMVNDFDFLIDPLNVVFFTIAFTVLRSILNIYIRKSRFIQGV